MLISALGDAVDPAVCLGRLLVDFGVLALKKDKISTVSESGIPRIRHHTLPLSSGGPSRSSNCTFTHNYRGNAPDSHLS